MSTLKDIDIRLQSFRNVKKITDTMYMISSSKLRKPRDIMSLLRGYLGVLHEGIVSLQNNDQESLFFKKGKGFKTALIVITSDMGLCGAFNHNVLREARSFLKKNSTKKFDIYGIGKKSQNLLVDDFDKYKIDDKKQYNNIFKKFDEIGKFGFSFIDEVINRILDDEYEEVVVIYNRYQSMISQEVVVDYFLPLKVSEFQKKEKVRNEEFIVEGSANVLIKNLLIDYIKNYFYLILVNSFTGENAARMLAMDSASNNAENLIDETFLMKNKLRQSKVTTEIAEIAAGSL